METTRETTVNDRGGTTIPSEIRESLDINSGDTIRWTVTDDGTLSAFSRWSLRPQGATEA